MSFTTAIAANRATTAAQTDFTARMLDAASKAAQAKENAVLVNSTETARVGTDVEPTNINRNDTEPRRPVSAALGKAKSVVSDEINFTRRILASVGASLTSGVSSAAMTQALEAAESSKASLAALETFLASARDAAVDGKVDLSALEAPESLAAGLTALEDATRADELTYKAEDGAVLLDAEQFTANKNGANGDDWVGNDDIGYMAATEVRGNRVYSGAEDIKQNAARLDYKVDFEEAGTYYVFVRGTSTYRNDTDSNSVSIGLNGEVLSDRGGVELSTRGFDWGSTDTFSGQRVAIEVTEPGTMTFNMWVREDGAAIDAILLTKDADFQPVGTRGLSISEMTTTKGEAGPVSLADLEALVADARAGYEADLAAAEKTIAEAGTTVTAEDMAPYLEKVLAAQMSGAETLGEVAQDRAARFDTAPKAENSEAVSFQSFGDFQQATLFALRESSVAEANNGYRSFADFIAASGIAEAA